MQPSGAEWYAWDGAVEVGPLTLDDIRARMGVGQLPPHTQIKQGRSGAWGSPFAQAAATAASDPSAFIGRAAIVGALTGLGFVLVSGIPLLIRYASRELLTEPLLVGEPKWHFGLVVAIAVVARILASGPRRDVVALGVSALAAALIGGGGVSGGLAVALFVAVIVQLRPVHGLLFALPALLFAWALATSGFDLSDGSVERTLVAGLPIAAWLGLAIPAGVVARSFARVS